MLKNDDVDAACKLIKYIHKYGRETYLSKRITIKLFKEDNYQVSARLMLKLNKNTKHVSINHSIKWHKKDIAPLKYENKLKCINEHGLKLIERGRTNANEYHKKNKVSKTIMSIKMDPVNERMSCGLQIVYNISRELYLIRNRMYFDGKSIFI